jgi:hypothetical protein
MKESKTLQNKALHYHHYLPPASTINITINRIALSTTQGILIISRNT